MAKRQRSFFECSYIRYCCFTVLLCVSSYAFSELNELIITSKPSVTKLLSLKKNKRIRFEGELSSPSGKHDEARLHMLFMGDEGSRPSLISLSDPSCTGEYTGEAKLISKSGEFSYTKFETPIAWPDIIIVEIEKIKRKSIRVTINDDVRVLDFDYSPQEVELKVYRGQFEFSNLNVEK